MSFDLPLCCRCGHVRGVARQLAPSVGFRLVCYCKDCQVFARVLGRADVLDAAGGTDIFQMPPGRLKIADGADALRCLRLHAGSQVLRWYADCCNTPIANTATSPRFPVVGVIHSFVDFAACGPRDEMLGRPLCRIYERSATGPLPAGAPPPPSLRVFANRAAKVLGWWVGGLGRPNPFFAASTGAPASAPRQLTPDERAAL
jgi:Family of unknown function (DUF6151)